MTSRLVIFGLGVVLLLGFSEATGTEVDVAALFDQAEANGEVGVARKTRLVDGRPARPGEIVVTTIRGEGKETQSPPAEAGDVVIRNRCPETGNEAYLVTAAKLPDRYEGPLGDADAAGWQPYRPKGIEMRYFILPEEAGAITFTAPWGEPMVARPGDAIVRNPADPDDTYRVARSSFACTYEIIEPVDG
jgi:hypothetical protein